MRQTRPGSAAARRPPGDTKTRSRRSPRDTRTRILDVAERLFATHGFEGVSTRTILAKAGVNMALAQYHFGGRDGLIREVLRRRIQPINERRLRQLAEAEGAAGPAGPPLEAVLRAFFAPLVNLLEETPQFARLLGHLHVTPHLSLRAFYRQQFEDVLRQFSQATRKSLPEGLSDQQRLCRGHFLLGAMIYTTTNYGDMTAFARGRYPTPGVDTVLAELVAFCTAGLTAPVADPEVER